jgi:hypothetical protein
MHNIPANYFGRHQSSIEDNTSEDVEEEGSTKGRELEDLVRW